MIDACFKTLTMGVSPRQFAIILLLSILSAAVDIFGIGALFAVIVTIVSDSSSVRSGFQIESFANYLGLDVIGFGIYIILFFGIVRFVIQILGAKFSNAFIYDSEAHIRETVVSEITSNPRVLETVSDELMINLLVVSPERLRDRFFSPLITLLVELFFLLLACALAFYLAPTVAFFSLILIGSLSLCWLMVTHQKFSNFGKDLMGSSSELMMSASSLIGGIKEAVLSGRSRPFTESVVRSINRLAKIQSGVAFLGSMPRYIIEFSIFFGVAVLLWLLDEGSFFDKEHLVSFFVGGGLVAARLLPMFSRLVSALSIFRTGLSVANDFINSFQKLVAGAPLFLLNGLDRSAGTNGPGVPALILNDLTVEKAGKSLFQAINLDFSAYQKMALKGVSGIGKSTALYLLANFWWKKNGERVGYSGQFPFVLAADLTANLTYGRGFDSTLDIHRVVLDSKFYTSLRDEFENIGSLKGQKSVSGGQAKRISILRAILNTDGYCFLDEPDSGLDEVQRKYLRILIGDLAKFAKFCIVTHGDFLDDAGFRVIEIKSCQQTLSEKVVNRRGLK